MSWLYALSNVNATYLYAGFIYRTILNPVLDKFLECSMLPHIQDFQQPTQIFHNLNSMNPNEGNNKERLQ
jgi:hypothetical protein